MRVSSIHCRYQSIHSCSSQILKHSSFVLQFTLNYKYNRSYVKVPSSAILSECFFLFLHMLMVKWLMHDSFNLLDETITTVIAGSSSYFISSPASFLHLLHCFMSSLPPTLLTVLSIQDTQKMFINGFLARVLSHVQLFVIPWTIAHQIPLSMETSRQEDLWN